MLDDELNRRAWADTLPRFAHRPAALDHGRYRRFAAFLADRGLIADSAARRQLRRRSVRGAEAMTDFVAEGVDRIRRDAPLVHNVTNLVAMTLSANVLIAVGASPIMSAAPEEAADLAALRAPGGQYRHADAGLDRRRARGGRRRPRADRPWVLDPVGVGATVFRRQTAQALVAQAPRIIRGNASEIMALAEGWAGGKGVDSTTGTEAAAAAAAATCGGHRRRGRGHRRRRSGDRREADAAGGQRRSTADPHDRLGLRGDGADRGLGSRPAGFA